MCKCEGTGICQSCKGKCIINGLVCEECEGTGKCKCICKKGKVKKPKKPVSRGWFIGM